MPSYAWHVCKAVDPKAKGLRPLAWCGLSIHKSKGKALGFKLANAKLRLAFIILSRSTSTRTNQAKGLVGFANWHSQLAGWGHTLIQGLCPWISFGSLSGLNTSPSGWYLWLALLFHLATYFPSFAWKMWIAKGLRPLAYYCTISSIQGLRPWISFGPSLQGKAKALPCAKGLRPFG